MQLSLNKHLQPHEIKSYKHISLLALSIPYKCLTSEQAFQ